MVRLIVKYRNKKDRFFCQNLKVVLFFQILKITWFLSNIGDHPFFILFWRWSYFWTNFKDDPICVWILKMIFAKFGVNLIFKFRYQKEMFFRPYFIFLIFLSHFKSRPRLLLLLTMLIQNPIKKWEITAKKSSIPVPVFS